MKPRSSIAQLVEPPVERMPTWAQIQVLAGSVSTFLNGSALPSLKAKSSGCLLSAVFFCTTNWILFSISNHAWSIYEDLGFLRYEHILLSSYFVNSKLFCEGANFWSVWVIWMIYSWMPIIIDVYVMLLCNPRLLFIKLTFDQFHWRNSSKLVIKYLIKTWTLFVSFPK